MLYPMTSESWTDERLDDLAAALRPLPEQVAGLVTAVDHLTEAIKAQREETRALRTDLMASQRQITMIGWGLVVALIGMVGALIAAV